MPPATAIIHSQVCLSVPVTRVTIEHHKRWTCPVLVSNYILCLFTIPILCILVINSTSSPIKHSEPPSPTRNVTVVNSTSTLVTLTWEEPLFTGGRSRDELRYSIWYRAARGFGVIMYGTVNTTVGETQGNTSDSQ